MELRRVSESSIEEGRTALWLDSWSRLCGRVEGRGWPNMGSGMLFSFRNWTADTLLVLGNA